MEKTKTNTQRSLWQDAWRRFRKNRTAMAGLIFLCLLVLIAVATVVIDVVTQKEFYNTYVTSQNLVERLKGPSLEHPFGQDEYGRDILMRMLWGVRYSLFMGGIAIIFSLIVGGALGAWPVTTARSSTRCSCALWTFCWPFPPCCWPRPSWPPWAPAWSTSSLPSASPISPPSPGRSAPRC